MEVGASVAIRSVQSRGRSFPSRRVREVVPEGRNGFSWIRKLGKDFEKGSTRSLALISGEYRGNILSGGLWLGLGGSCGDSSIVSSFE